MFMNFSPFEKSQIFYMYRINVLMLMFSEKAATFVKKYGFFFWILWLFLKTSTLKLSLCIDYENSILICTLQAFPIFYSMYYCIQVRAWKFADNSNFLYKCYDIVTKINLKLHKDWKVEKLSMCLGSCAIT